MAKRPTSAELRHMNAIKRMPCLTCGARPVEVHHVVGYADRMGRAPKRHNRIVPLCPHCHRTSLRAVHAINHRNFCAEHGIDLMAEAERLANG